MSDLNEENADLLASATGIIRSALGGALGGLDDVGTKTKYLVRSFVGEGPLALVVIGLDVAVELEKLEGNNVRVTVTDKARVAAGVIFEEVFEFGASELITLGIVGALTGAGLITGTTAIIGTAVFTSVLSGIGVSLAVEGVKSIANSPAAQNALDSLTQLAKDFIEEEGTPESGQVQIKEDGEEVANFKVYSQEELDAILSQIHLNHEFIDPLGNTLDLSDRFPDSSNPASDPVLLNIMDQIRFDLPFDIPDGEQPSQVDVSLTDFVDANQNPGNHSSGDVLLVKRGELDHLDDGVVLGGNGGFTLDQLAAGDVLVVGKDTTVFVSPWGDLDYQYDPNDLSSGSDPKPSSVMGNFTEPILDTLNYASTFRSPLILDLDGDGVEVVHMENGVFFDIDNDGFRENVGWVDVDDGLLAMDRNGNGQIDNVTELYGNDVMDAYDKLALHDSNNDGFVDILDEDFADLLIWKDANRNGLAEEGELLPLSSYGIVSLALAHEAEETFIHENFVSASSEYYRSDGSVGLVEDVHFLNDDVNSRFQRDAEKLDNVFDFYEAGFMHNFALLYVA